MNQVEILKQYALDNYEAGGHWVFDPKTPKPP